MNSIEIGISLGTNLGDRLANLKAAKQKIISNRGLILEAQSSVYETEPVDVPEEHKDKMFLNSVLIVSTKLPAHQLLPLLKYIEQEIGREPSTIANAPRPIDLDIIYAGNLQINEEHLIIPHPRWHTRRFVLKPLSDVRPELVILGQTKTVLELLNELKDNYAVKPFASAKQW